MQNINKKVFPVELNYDIHNFKPYDVLKSSQLNTFQENINNIFSIIEEAINILNEKSSGSFAEFIGYKGKIAALNNSKFPEKISLENLKSARSGDIYLLDDSIPNIKEFNFTYGTDFHLNDILLCAYDFNLNETSSSVNLSYDQIWSTKNNLLEAANTLHSGLITNHLQSFRGLKGFLDGIIIRDSLDIDVNHLSLKQNGELLIIPKKEDFIKMREDLNFLLENNIIMEPIPSEEINALF